MTPHLLPKPKSFEDAQSAFLRQMGDPRRLSKMLATVVVIGTIIVAALTGLLFKIVTTQRERIVIRIDELGRAQALGISNLSYTVQPVEMKYFLGQFVHDYYGRNRTTVHQDFARSMLFLNPQLASKRMQGDAKDIEKFIANGDDEIEVVVRNIVLVQADKSPYVAQVDIEKISRQRGGIETKRERFVEGITFSVASEVPNAAILVNPLGFTILSLREDQDFSVKENQ